jgi:hypothetical protein
MLGGTCCPRNSIGGEEKWRVAYERFGGKKIGKGGRMDEEIR